MQVSKCCSLSLMLVILGGIGSLDSGRTSGADVPQPEEFFAAVDRHELRARFIASDATEARLLLTNLTDHPLDLRMPAAIAAVPVLGQFGNAQGIGNQQGQGGGPQGVGQGQGGGQTLGAGAQGQGQQGQGQGFGQNGGVMRIPPGKTLRIKLVTVCLQHGKPEPHPRMQYTVVPIDAFTDDVIIAELCAMLGREKVSQPVAQAAAWNVLDGMNWTTLADKNQFESKYVGQIKFFTPEEIDEAKKLVEGLRNASTLVSKGYSGE